MLDVLLALERSHRSIVRFEVDEPLDSIFAAKSADEAFAMFVNTANEIVRHADVQRSARTAGENVNPVAHTQRHARARPAHPSIFAKSRSKLMDCRVKPGNDDFCEWCSYVQPPSPSARSTRTQSQPHRAARRIRIRRTRAVDAARLQRPCARGLSRQRDRAS